MLLAGKFFGKGGDPPVQTKLEDAFRGKRKRSAKAEKDGKVDEVDTNPAKAEQGALFAPRLFIILSTSGVSSYTLPVTAQRW